MSYNNRIDKLEFRMDALESYLEKKITLELQMFKQDIESKLEKIDSKIDNLNSRIDNLDSKIDNLESKISTLDSRLGRVESFIYGIIAVVVLIPILKEVVLPLLNYYSSLN